MTSRPSLQSATEIPRVRSEAERLGDDPPPLPCPFCGRTDLLGVESHPDRSLGSPSTTLACVRCRACGTAGPATKGSRGDAIERWNCRSERSIPFVDASLPVQIRTAAEAREAFGGGNAMGETAAALIEGRPGASIPPLRSGDGHEVDQCPAAMTIDLDDLERKARAATGQPDWRVYCCSEASPGEACAIIGDPHRSGVVHDTNNDECQHHMARADAEHIAANGPPVTLALIARIRELEGVVRALAVGSLVGEITASRAEKILEKGTSLP